MENLYNTHTYVCVPIHILSNQSLNLCQAKAWVDLACMKWNGMCVSENMIRVFYIYINKTE